MLGPRDLLRRARAPAPVAEPMQTEIRTGGNFSFRVLQAPHWAEGHPTPVILQFTCKVPTVALLKLWLYLRESDGTTGLAPEAAIDWALQFPGRRIGIFLGVFVDEGRPPYTLRVMTGVDPERVIDEERLNLDLHALFTFDGSQMGNGYPETPEDRAIYKQAAEALQRLRDSYVQGQQQAEPRSMLLSQTDMDKLVSPAMSPFLGPS